MDTLHNDMLLRLSNVPWWVNCGNPHGDRNVIAVKTWRAATTEMKRPAWEDTRLEAANSLAAFMALTSHDAWNRWNNHVANANPIIDINVRPAIDRATLDHGLPEKFRWCVEWDLLHAILEDIYRDYCPTVKFFTDLFEIYNDGHLPCGWRGGTWPEGQLVVF